MALIYLADQTSTVGGSSFDGALAGQSVSIGGQVVRGTTSRSGIVKSLKAVQVSLPFWATDNIKGPASDNTYVTLLEFNTLPQTLPFRNRLRFQRQRIVRFFPETPSSFSPVTIGAFDVRASTIRLGSVAITAYQPDIPPAATVRYYVHQRITSQYENLTTTQNQTGVANISPGAGVTTTQDQSGVANIRATTEQTQSGVARIIEPTTVHVVTAGTIFIHEVTPTNVRVASAGTIFIYQPVASITVDQTGVANIRVTTTQDQAGKANIRATTTQDQTGVAAIVEYGTTSQTQSGVANIRATTEQTQSGTAAIRGTTTQDQTGVAAIVLAQNTAQQTGVARIQATTQQTQTGVAFIQTFVDYEVDIAGDSTLILNGKHYDLAPDYYAAVIDSDKELTTTIVNDSFTASSITAQGYGSAIGRLNRRYAFGVTRAPEPLIIRSYADYTRQEYIRIEIAVDTQTDTPLITDTVGFTATGISSIGSEVLVGRIKEDYATYSLLTSVRSTSETLEILATGDPSIEATQVCYEMLFIPASYVHNTQNVLEVLYLSNIGQIQQVAVETMAGEGDRSVLAQQVAVEMIHSIKATTEVTEVNEEILKGPNPDGIGEGVDIVVTNTNFEILTYTQLQQFSSALINQNAIESIHNSQDVVARFQHEAVETIHNNNRFARIQHEAVETIHNNNRNGVLNQLALEEIGNSVNPPLFVNGLAVELLVRPEYDPRVSGMVNNPRYHI